MRRRLAESLPILLLGLGMLGVGLKAARGAFDNDLWWHLRLGYDFMSQGNLQPPNDWSPMATEHWVPTEPLPEIAAALAHEWAGYNGVAWLFAVGCMGVVLCTYIGNRSVSRPAAASVVAVIAIVGCSVSLTPRPQLVSFCLVPILLRAWNRTAEDLQARWYLIPMTYGWSLCHGFWFIGVLYGFLEVAGLLLDRRIGARQLVSLAVIPLASAAVVMLNPVGLGVFEAPLVVNDVTQYVSEWQHPAPTNLAVRVVALMLIATTVLVLSNRNLWSWRRFFLVLSIGFWLWYSWRTVALASLVAAPLLAEGIEALMRRADRATESQSLYSGNLAPKREVKRLAAWVLSSALGLAIVIPSLTEAPNANTPVDVALDQLPRGTVVFNYYDIGGWMTWRHPDLGQVIDGLVTPYSANYVGEYFRATQAEPGWQTFVARTHARVAVLLVDSPLAEALKRIGWTTWASYEDYVLLRKTRTREPSLLVS